MGTDFILLIIVVVLAVLLLLNKVKVNLLGFVLVGGILIEMLFIDNTLSLIESNSQWIIFSIKILLGLGMSMLLLRTLRKASFRNIFSRFPGAILVALLFTATVLRYVNATFDTTVLNSYIIGQTIAAYHWIVLAVFLASIVDVLNDYK